jgi:periplasmic divalent cation tolerance protein
MNTERAVFVYTTYPSLVEAEKTGRALVEQRLCACVNILPGMVSHYWWNGALERGEEVVMIVKTRASYSDAVSAAVKQGHSYATPAILVLPIESVDETYFEWLMTETEQPEQEGQPRQ